MRDLTPTLQIVKVLDNAQETWLKADAISIQYCLTNALHFDDAPCTRSGCNIGIEK